MNNITSPDAQILPLSPFLTIAHDWFGIIIDDKGRADHFGINLMGVLFSFFRNPPSDPDFYNGPELPYVEKGKLVVNYEYISNKFGCSNETIRRCFVRLEKLELLKRETINVQLDNGQRINKVYIIFSAKFLNSSVRDPETDLRASPHKKKTPFNLESSRQDSQLCGHLIKDSENIYNNRSMGSNFTFEDFGINKLTSSDYLSNKQQGRIEKKINTLRDFYPLSDKDTEELQMLSGREFSKGAMNGILLSMANKLPGREFFSKKGFLKYMSKAFSYEKRQASLANNENFRIKANYSQEEIYTQEREKFLSNLEYSLDTSPEMHFKKKLAAVLKPETAYQLLKSYISIRFEGEEIIILLDKSVSLKQTEQDLILAQANAVYSRIWSGGVYPINSLKVEEKKKNFLRESSVTSTEKISKSFSIFEGIWGNIRKRLISELGNDGSSIDKAWFSRLENEVDEKTKILTLKAPCGFFRDYIERNYLHKLRRCVQSEGYELGQILA